MSGMMGKVGSLSAIFLILIMVSATVAPNFNASADNPLLIAYNDGTGTIQDGIFDPLLNIGENSPVPLIIDVQNNDFEQTPSGTTPNTVIVTNPAHGTVTVNPDTTVSYTPNQNYFGPDSFTYQLCSTVPSDGACSNIATVFITVTQVIVANNPPTAVPDHYLVNPGSVYLFNVLANDTDPENNPIHVVAYTSPICAAVTLNANGTFTYNTFEDTSACKGTDGFSYTINDNFTHGAPCTTTDQSGCLPQQTTSVSVTINHVNQPPFAFAVTPTTTENTPVSFQLSANDPDGDTLTYSVLTQPTHGTLSGTVPNLTYTPNKYFAGSDSFTYKANDGTVDSNIATVTITVTHVNQPPVAFNDRYSTNENTPKLMNVLANDTDPDIPTFGDALTIVSTTTPLHGILTTNLNNTLSYKPSSNYFGPDSFTYTISDTGGLTSTATVSVTVNHVNQPPVAGNVLVSTAFNTPVAINVLSSATDPDIPNPGDTLTVKSITSPSHGTAKINLNNTITYTPTTGYSGSDSFTFTISDSGGLTSTATANVNIALKNNPPIAPNYAFTLVAGQTSQNVNLLAAAYDPDPGDTISVVSYTNPTHGTLSGTVPNLTYTPTPGYYGSDSFTYTISDNHGATATATVTFTIVKPNSPPVAVNDAANTVLNTPVAIKVLANDYDPDPGDTISVVSFTSPSNGAIVLNPDNTFTYTPNHNYSGSDSFTYVISDNHGALSVPATVTITILKSTPGEIEGDGSIGKKTSFDFEVESKDGVIISGDLKYKDPSKINLKSSSFTTLYVDSTQTQGGFSGVAKVNGHDDYTFQVVVTSTGSEHHQNDTFSITILDPNGHAYYSNSGTLTDGKIDISSHGDEDDEENNHGDNNHGDNNHGDKDHR